MILPPVPATLTNLLCLQRKTEEVSPIARSQHAPSPLPHSKHEKEGVPAILPPLLLVFAVGEGFSASHQSHHPCSKCEREGSSGQLSPFPVVFWAGQGFSPTLLEHQWHTRLDMSLVFNGYYSSTSIRRSPEACPSGHVLGIWWLSLPLPPLKQQWHTHLGMLLMFIA